MANLLGHLFFDGSVPRAQNGKYILNYTNSSSEAITNFVKNVESVFGVKPQKVQKVKGKNVDWYMVSFMSKKAWKHVKSFSDSFSTKENIGVPKQIKAASPGINSAFLKAFWDDEGSISFDGRLTGVSKSKKMIEDLVEMHVSLGVGCYFGENKKSNSYVIRVKRSLGNVLRFSERVGFEYGRVIRGHNLGKLKKDVLQRIISAKVGP